MGRPTPEVRAHDYAPTPSDAEVRMRDPGPLILCHRLRRPAERLVSGCSGGDFLALLAGDLNLARPRPLGNRDLQPQHAGVVARGHVFGVQVLAED
jgi:hypothetical protein